ncbi:ATP-binding protein [Clostridium hydrogenum]|uniref:ATP-binding protein n=1 Tax=Clostridium hydrogenum TaxID=2855764 RepID=UPI001F419340|nr:ATP-binding protein [Clostridium hydrogenum]
MVNKKVSDLVSTNLYKILISIILGLIGFVGTFFTLRFKVNKFYLDFVWSLIFPALVTQAWGIKYGIISAFAGLSIFHPFYLWGNEGWACFVNFFTTIFWFVLHGYGAEKRKKSKKYFYNIYFIEVVCFLIAVLSYFFLFPLVIKYNTHFLYKHVITQISIEDIHIFFIKRIIQDFFILIGCDVLLLLPGVKKLFLFNVESASRYNGTILVRTLIIGVVFWFVSIFIEFLMPLKDNLQAISKIIDARDIIYLIILTMFCCFTASITIRYLEKKQKAEELVRKSERKQAEVQEEYKLIFDKMLEGMVIAEFMYDEEGEAVDMMAIKANPAIDKQLGLKECNAIGTKYIESFRGNKSTLKKLYNILKTDMPLQCEAFAHRFNRYLLVNAFKINSKQIGVMFHDISELKQLEANKLEMAEKLEAVFESTDDIIYSVDREYRILNFNSALKAHMKRNYDVEARNGQSILEFVPNNIAQRWKGFYDHAMSNGKCNFEDYVKNEKRDIEIFFNPIYHNGEISGTAVFVKDITKRKKAEQMLIKINQKLEQLVEERTIELRNTITELEAFTCTASHDLKSPLRAIDGYSRIILEDYGEKLEKEAIHMISNISNVSCDMIKLIDKILQYSTTSKAIIQKEKVDIKGIFIDAFNELKSTCLERNIEFSIETTMPIVNADRILIRQVVYNILSNSLKFTKNRDIAIINVGCIQNCNEQTFYVEDNGAGFDMKYVKKLFTMFQRLHNKEEYEGSGIGLAIVNKIIKKHMGRTWIESKLNEGSKVYFTLPRE